MRPPADPVVVRQWVAAVGLTLQAEEISRRAAEVDRVTAIILADTAAEMALGLIASRSRVPLQNESHGELLKQATLVARLDARLVSELRAIRKLRNGAVHQGADVGVLDASRALQAARSLLDTYVPRAMRHARALGYGRGIGDAVASLLPGHPIGPMLGAAQSALPRNPRLSLESTSAVVWLLEEYASPGLPTRHGAVRFTSLRLSSMRRNDPLQALGDAFPRELIRLSERVERVAEWTVPLALGLSPAEYARLLEALPGTVSHDDHTFEHRWDGRPEPTLESARRSLERASHLVLRLWWSDLLRYPEA